MIHETVAILPIKDGKVLLIKRLNEPEKGRWAVPGGHVDDGETPREAAAREATEEVGSVRIVGEELFVFIHDVGEGEAYHPEEHKHNGHVFRGEVHGEIKTGTDAGEHIWVNPEKALDMNITGYTKYIIERFLKD
ncbi:MAG: NUDIX domain-containing protein [Candidatus Aenigmatarchaeota archaeon]|nr:MAG: NUDIX domain-containing protein [Candidatus Aenigmarchaeota archaeon]